MPERTNSFFLYIAAFLGGEMLIRKLKYLKKGVKKLKKHPFRRKNRVSSIKIRNTHHSIRDMLLTEIFFKFCLIFGMDFGIIPNKMYIGYRI